jgi:sialic acid synthase SpsE
VTAFKKSYDYGYSDHSVDVMIIPILAKHHGCSVIEKHVNFTDHTDTDDAPHSLNAHEFALMVQSIHGDYIDLKDTAPVCTWQRTAHVVKGVVEYFRTK